MLRRENDMRKHAGRGGTGERLKVAEEERTAQPPREPFQRDALCARGYTRDPMRSHV